MQVSDRQSVHHLWQEHHDALLAFIRSRVTDKDLSSDILQDVFVKILEKIDTLEESDKVRSWLFQITRNAIIDQVRKDQSRMNRELVAMSVSDQESDDVAMEHIASCIRPMIDSLPTKYREALLLSELEGLSQKELAARLGISYSGAKSRVQRGRMLLRQTLLDCCTFELTVAVKFSPIIPIPSLLVRTTAECSFRPGFVDTYSTAQRRFARFSPGILRPPLGFRPRLLDPGR